MNIFICSRLVQVLNVYTVQIYDSFIDPYLGRPVDC